MKINTKATNITLTPSISEYIEKKAKMLEKYFTPEEEVLVNIEVGKISKHHKTGDVFRAEMHVIHSGQDYYTEAEDEDLYAAIDEAKDEIVHSLTSRRKKAMRLVRRGGAQIKNLLKGMAGVGGRGWRRLKKFRNKDRV